MCSQIQSSINAWSCFRLYKADCVPEDPPLEGEEKQDILANEQHIYSAEIEFVVVRESSKTVISRMHSSIKL